MYLILITYSKLFQNTPNTYFVKRIINGFNIDTLLIFKYTLLVLLSVAVLNCLFLKIIKSNIKKKNTYFVILFIITIQFFVLPSTNNELFSLCKTLFYKDKVVEYYENERLKLIKDSIENKENLISQLQKNNLEGTPSYLENIIILQVESMNGYLVNKKTTPNFLEIADNGILFPQFYSNSIETILGQENLLCSIPGSIKSMLIYGDYSDKILCWPEIMKHLGYKTFFFKSYNLDFARTGELMQKLQFDEIHADDIMSKDDPQYPWGFREDIFYQKVFDYIGKNKKEQNFFYIEIGPTNHWPFNTPPKLKSIVPHKNPKNHQEKLINTTFLQDKYLAIAWEKINEIFPEKNYTLIILSDHSWPAEFHKDNTLNQRMAFEENFITSLALILGNKKEYKEKKITNMYSHLDILPTFLDFFQIKYPKNKFSQSFLPELLEKENYEKFIPLIQPSDNECPLNFIKNNLKYQYNANKKQIIIYDLDKDPEEKNGQIIGHNPKENIKIIKKLLK